jgi:DNA mismatch repair protein MutS2
VKQEHKAMVKGIVHDESASGATVNIEPLPVVELNNQMRALQMEEKREIERILRELSQLVGSYSQELARNQDLLGLLDFIFARARLAYKMNAFRPITNRRGIMQIYRGKHPLLGEEAVPVDVEQIEQHGWESLSNAACGRIGGIMSKRLKERKQVEQ